MYELLEAPFRSVISKLKKKTANFLLKSYSKVFSKFLGLLSAGAMGFWHGVEYYEKERPIGEEFYQQWSNVRPQNLRFLFFKIYRVDY